jgi:transposase
MPPAKPPEFRRRAIALARAGDQSMDRIVADLGIAESCLRRWLKWTPVGAATG